MKPINFAIENKAVAAQIFLPGVEENKNIYIKREDLIHNEISGNKWRKLKYNLLEAEKLGKKTLLTFGGAYSNHIYAVAAAGKEYGFNTIGIIRGEKYSPLNPTLRYASDCGMEIQYLSRELYRNRNNQKFQDEYLKQNNDIYIIPEGGTNTLAVKGCAEIVDDINIDYDIICCACGTGGTLAGITAGLDGKHKAIGFPVLKGGGYLNGEIKKLINKFNSKTYSNWELNTDYHFGGYAKINYKLISFINEFEKTNGIKLDPIYTGKLMYGVSDLIKKNFFKNDEKIIVLHTGGLQGIEGMKNKINKTMALHSSVS